MGTNPQCRPPSWGRWRIFSFYHWNEDLLLSSPTALQRWGVEHWKILSLSISPISVSTIETVMSCLWNMTVAVTVPNKLLSDHAGAELPK